MVAEMISPDDTRLQKAVVSMIRRRAGSSADATAVAAAAGRAYEDLVAALVPLISQAGLDALVGRALYLAAPGYPFDHTGEKEAAEAFGQISLWLEGQDPTAATDAAAAIFTKFAALLAALIGQPLTTRYLRKAWPDGFTETSEGTQA